MRALATDGGWPRWRLIVGLLSGSFSFEELFDPYSGRNAWRAAGPDQPAARTAADSAAVEAILASGMVFHGKLARQIPIIDLRDYLEPVLDMHHARASFVARARMLAAQGHADSHRIWFVDSNPNGVAPPIEDISHLALDVIAARLGHASGDELAAGLDQDACFEADGHLIAASPDAWAGVLDDRPPGPYTQRFPLFSNSPIEASGPFTDDVFQCRLIPVANAIAGGMCCDWVPDAGQRHRLETIFPEGVCEF